MQTFTGVASGSFTAPEHDYPSHLELAPDRDRRRRAHRHAERLPLPEDRRPHVRDRPAGLTLGAGGASAATPFVRTVIVGSNVSVAAPSPQIVAPATHWFSEWSDQGAPSHTIVAPATDAVYAATYLLAPPPLPLPWVDEDVGSVGMPGRASWLSYGSGTFTVRGAGTTSG